MMSLIWQRTCLHLQKTHLLWAGDRPYFGRSGCAGGFDLTMLSLPLKGLPGQFDQRAASSQEALLLLGSSSDVTVNTAQLYLVNKDIDATELEAVKNYLLNPVDSRFKDITTGIAKQEFSESDKTIPKIDFLWKLYGRRLCSLQGRARDGTMKWMICSLSKTTSNQSARTDGNRAQGFDTYWSWPLPSHDFDTELKHIDFSASKFQKQLSSDLWQVYCHAWGTRSVWKPQTLMDMATIFGRYERANDRLDEWK